MFTCMFILETLLADEPGQPLVEATREVCLPARPNQGDVVRIPIPGGIVYPDTDDNGTCLCTKFGQCCHPNKPWDGRCSVEDLEEEAVKGHGPGGYFAFPITAVILETGSPLLVIRCDCKAVSGRSLLDLLARSGFTIVIKVKPPEAEPPDDEEEEDAEEVPR